MNVKCRWCHLCAKEDMEIIAPHYLEKVLPEEHCHWICSYTPLEHGFTASVKLKLYTREEAEKWMKDFQRSSNVTLRVAKTYPRTEDTVQRNSYRVDMRCQHNTRQTGLTKKNTNCPAGLYLVLKKQTYSQNRKSRSTDSHIQEGLLLHVTIKHLHNHRLEAVQQRHVPRKEAFSEMATGKRDVIDTWFMGLEEDCSTVPHHASTQEQAGEGCEAETTAAPTLGEGSRTGEASTQKEHLEGRLRSMFDVLMDKLRKDQSFQAPIESLVSSYERISTDKGLISALSTFGKGRNPALRHRPRKGLQTNTPISKETTAAAQQKSPLEGRRVELTAAAQQKSPLEGRRVEPTAAAQQKSPLEGRRVEPTAAAQQKSPLEGRRVEPTAAAHRKSPLEGRQVLITGPPPKRAREEQDYRKGKEESALQRRLASHSPGQPNANPNPCLLVCP